MNDFSRTPARTKVLLVLVNAWLVVCVVLIVSLVRSGDEGGGSPGPSAPAAGVAAGRPRAPASGEHDWLADFGEELGAEFRTLMESRNVLAPDEAESFQRQDLPELAFADLDEPIPEAAPEPYVEPDFPDWMVQRGEAEGDIDPEGLEEAGEAREPEEPKDSAGAAARAAGDGKRTRAGGAAGRRAVAALPGRAVGDPDALLSPLPRTERRRLSPRSRRPMTLRDRRIVTAILKSLSGTRGAAGLGISSGRRGRSPGPAERLAALSRLRVYDDPAVSRSLVFLATDPDRDVRKRLVEVLTNHDNIGAAGVLLYILSLGDPVTELSAREGLASLRDEGTVTWLHSKALLRGANGVVRSAAADALGRIGEERAIPSLVRALRDVDGRVRSSAALALGRLRATEAAEPLIRLTRDRAAHARAAACLSLGALRDPASVPALVARLKDRDANVRSSAARALAALRSAEAVGPLIDALAREPSRVRDDLVRALTLTTGMRYAGEADQWRNWWRLCGGDYSVPALGLAAAALHETELRDVDYYGISTRSTRIIFLVDVSGSMAGAKLEAAKAELQKTIGGFTERHFFNMVFFDSGVRSWRGRLVQATKASIAQASSYVYRLEAGGMTNAYGALVRALRDPYVDTVFLLSDGRPTAGKITEPDVIRAVVRRMNPTNRVVIHCIGIGHHDRDFMKGLAEDSGGTYVTPGR